MKPNIAVTATATVPNSNVGIVERNVSDSLPFMPGIPSVRSDR